MAYYTRLNLIVRLTILPVAVSIAIIPGGISFKSGEVVFGVAMYAVFQTKGLMFLAYAIGEAYLSPGDER